MSKYSGNLTNELQFRHSCVLCSLFCAQLWQQYLIQARMRKAHRKVQTWPQCQIQLLSDARHASSPQNSMMLRLLRLNSTTTTPRSWPLDSRLGCRLIFPCARAYLSRVLTRMESLQSGRIPPRVPTSKKIRLIWWSRWSDSFSPFVLASMRLTLNLL